MKKDFDFLLFQSEGAHFVEKILSEADSLKIKLYAFLLDHICYRTSSQEIYESLCGALSLNAILLIEADVSGRLISTFKLPSPIKASYREIYLIEVPKPKSGSPCADGFEHAEFVINESFEDLTALYENISFDLSSSKKSINPEIKILMPSGLSLKFHRQSLEDVILDEIKERELSS